MMNTDNEIDQAIHDYCVNMGLWIARQKGYAVTAYEKAKGIKPKLTPEIIRECYDMASDILLANLKEEEAISDMYVL